MSATNVIQYFAAGEEHTYVAHPGGVAPGTASIGATMVAIVDSADEIYTTASLPAVGRSYMQSLMRRRLAREFPDCSLRTALRMPHKRSDGQNDVVMIAIAADAALEARLSGLGNHHALRAVTTPSLLVCAWMKRARLRPRRVLVVLPTPAGLRLVFVENGVPSLSRLMPPLDTGGTTATEIARTIQYLQNTQRVDRNEPLELWFWGLEAEQVGPCLPAGVPHIAGTTPVPARMPDPVRNGFRALLEFAARDFKGVQLVGDQQRLGWFAKQTVRWGRHAAAAVLLLCAGVSAAMHVKARDVQREAADFTAQIEAITTDHAVLEQQLADRSLKLEDIRVLPDTEQALRASQVQIGEALDLAGKAFGADASVQLMSLEFMSAPAMTLPEAPDRSCDGEPLPQIPSLRMTFALAEDLPVRQRATALQRLRDSLVTLATWKPTDRSASVGAGEALTIAAGVEPPIVTREWTVCLSRGEAGS